VIAIVRGLKIVQRTREETWVEVHNQAIDDVIEEFMTFQIPQDVPGAMALDTADLMLVHIGALFPQIPIEDENNDKNEGEPPSTDQPTHSEDLHPTGDEVEEQDTNNEGTPREGTEV